MRDTPLLIPFKLARLMVEVQMVIGLWIMRFTAGGEIASRELMRVYAEKVDTAVDGIATAIVAIVAGKPPHAMANRVIRSHAARIRANHRGLT